MKLFGTHVYPKNKYLTLQLTKSFKGVTCEDIFESMVCFRCHSFFSQVAFCRFDDFGYSICKFIFEAFSMQERNNS